LLVVWVVGEGRTRRLGEWRDRTALVLCGLGGVNATMIVGHHVVGYHAFSAFDLGLLHLHGAMVAVQFVVQT
jgi:hypothetical protein